MEPLVTTSLRLRSELRAYLEDLALRSQRSVSDVAQQLLEEAIRTRECPGIYFAEEPAGRTAKIMGTGLGVWEVIRDYLAVGEREDRLREIFPQLTTLSRTPVESAYPDQPWASGVPASAQACIRPRSTVP